MSFVRAHKIGIGIFFLALVVRLCYFGLALNAHDGDLIATSRASDGYFIISQNILQGHGFSSADTAPFIPNSYRAPLQPYFLAASAWLTGSYYGPLILTMLISCFFPLFGMRFARFLSLSPKLVLAVGIFLALEPVSVLFSILFYSETLFMLFFFLSLYYLFRYFEQKQFLHMLFSSAFLGFATLTRPTTEYLPLIIAVIIIWEARKHLTKRVWFQIGTYLLVFFIVLTPWLLRNKAQFGVLALSPQAGVGLYATLLPSVLSIENGTSFDTEYEKIQTQNALAPNRTAVDETQGYASKAVALLLEHKTAFLLTAATVEISFFTHDGMLDVLRILKIRPDIKLGTPALFLLLHDPLKLLSFIWHYLYSPIILVFLMRILWIVITFSFFVGAVQYIRKMGMTPYVLVMLTTIFYIALITILVGLSINSRLRLPVEVLIVPLAFYGLAYMARRFTQSPSIPKT